MDFIVNGVRHSLTTSDVADRVRGHHADPVREHAVYIGGRQFPVKQAFSIATGLHTSEFTSQRARDVLRRLGFSDAPTEQESDQWILETRTLAGGYQEFRLTDEAQAVALRANVANLIAAADVDELLAYSRNPESGLTPFQINWAHVSAAAVYRQPTTQ